MSPTVLSSLLKLPRKQRLALAERLWFSVADEAKMPVPEEHRRIINERLARYKSGKSKTISHEELMRRVRSA